MAEISAEDVAAAEASLVQIKESGDREQINAAMQAVADLREGFRRQEAAAGRRSGLVTAADNDGTDEGGEG